MGHRRPIYLGQTGQLPAGQLSHAGPTRAASGRCGWTAVPRVPGRPACREASGASGDGRQHVANRREAAAWRCTQTDGACEATTTVSTRRSCPPGPASRCRARETGPSNPHCPQERGLVVNRGPASLCTTLLLARSAVQARIGQRCIRRLQVTRRTTLIGVRTDAVLEARHACSAHKDLDSATHGPPAAPIQRS
ncbi:hypothetical protein FHY19_003536 [Xanthomonas arboricola]|nr:hypothetical protein [Xanthomonas sp. 4461]